MELLVGTGGGLNLRSSALFVGIADFQLHAIDAVDRVDEQD